MHTSMNISQYLEEDLGKGDITTDTLLGEEEASGIIIAREPCTLAGLEEAGLVFKQFGIEVEDLSKDGSDIKADTQVLRVKGKAHAILKAERTALNILMRMSGIATKTRSLILTCRPVNPKIIIACTRKTTPGFRYFEKKAVVLGGGDPHRYGLDDAILIKDNHLAVVGGIEQALEKAKAIELKDKETSAPEFATRSFAHRKIEIEVEDLKGAVEAAKAGAEIIMLDNFDPDLALEAYNIIKDLDPDIIVEASGGINYDNIADYAQAADVISLGTLTHSYKSIDFSLELEFEFDNG
jgi:nicotinate-nucleotide pyrophosphorylase (carboxylating)